MRVLFFVEPLVERENPTWKAGWVSHFVKKISSALIAEGISEEDQACIVPTALGAAARIVLPRGRVVSIDHTELVPRFGSSALEIASNWYEGSASDQAMFDMAALVKERVGDFCPTCCITFSPAPYLNKAWPSANVLHLEYGLVSRPPFPETVYFDPNGMFSASTLARYIEQWRERTPKAEELALLSELRERYCHFGQDNANPLADLMAKVMPQYESAILLALQFSNFYAYNANAQLADQYDLLVHTLESTPRNIAVVVCEHPEHPVLKPEVIAYLRTRYPNFVWDPLIRSVYGASYYLMPHVQGVVTVSSSVGLQALLWKKKLTVLGGGHLAAVCDTSVVSKLPSLLGGAWPAEKDRVLCWLLSSFHLPLDLLLKSGKLSAYLKALVPESIGAIDAARVQLGLDASQIRQAYQAAWEMRPLSPYATALPAFERENLCVALYVATDGCPYDEQRSLRKFLNTKQGQVNALSFILDRENQKPIAVRFDPSDCAGFLQLRELNLLDAKGAVLWTWRGSASGMKSCLGVEVIPNAHGALFVCSSNDPQIELNIDFDLYRHVHGPFEIRVEMNAAGVADLAPLVSERDGQIVSLSHAVAGRDEHILSLNQTVLERDGQIVSLSQAVAGRDEHILSLNQTVLERDGQIASLSQAVSQRDGQISRYGQTVEEIYGSTSWRLSAPVRWVGSQVRAVASCAALWSKAAAAWSVLIRLLRTESLPSLISRSLRVWRREGFSGILVRMRQQHFMSKTATAVATDGTPIDLGFALEASVLTRDHLGKYALKTLPCDYTYVEPQQPTDFEARLATFSSCPRFSIVVPVYNTAPDLLAAVLSSVQGQWYPHWELILADDASPSAETKAALAAIAHPQIKVLHLEKNQGIAGATNVGLDSAQGDFVVFMDHDDELTVDCLYELALCIEREHSDFVYSDEDKLDQQGNYIQPHFKPDWSPDTMMSTMFTCHVSCVRRSLLEKVGGLRAQYDGCQDWDFVLRVSEHTSRISHVAKVLYHWRIIPASIASDIGAKPYVLDASRRVRADALERRGMVGSVEALPQFGGYFRVNYHLRGTPMVSIIIPSRDNGEVLERCVESIYQKSSYRNFEIIVLDNGSVKPDTLAYMARAVQDGQIRVIRHDAPFNFSELNNIGAAQAKGELLLFLNDDTEVLVEDWLERLGGYAQLPHVGAVGAKLLYPGGREVQHAGVLNLANGPGHAFLRQPAQAPGYFMRNVLEYNWLAVTGACLMMEAKKFRDLGRFDESFPIAYNDVELCFRSATVGLYNVVCQAAVLIHHESISRGVDHIDPVKMARLTGERHRLYEAHPAYFQRDPFHNPNLHPSGVNFEVPC